MAMFWAPVANVVLAAVRKEEEGQASGAQNAIRELGGVFGVAVLASIWSHYGSYGTGAAFVDGMTPAIWVGAAIVLLGALAAFAIPHRRRAAEAPAVEPAIRWHTCLPDLIRVAQYASARAAQHPDWVGSTQIFTHLADEPTSVNIRPVFLSGHLVGNLISFSASDGEQLPQAEGSAHPRVQPRRLVAIRDNRMVLLRLSEVYFAESDGNDVWLFTDQGRLRAASPGLDKLAGALADAGFLRVHRRYVVNLSRIREIERGFKGELILVMDDRTNETVPVSRRNAPAVRRALDI
jgi:hypothetical protein